MKRNQTMRAVLAVLMSLCLCFAAACRLNGGEHVHSYVDTVTPPTCTEEGYTIHTCNCGESYKDSIVPAAGHKMKNGVCEVCGAREEPDDQTEFFFALNPDGESYTVTGNRCTSKRVVIPGTYKGKPVTAIGYYAFGDNFAMTSVVIPASVVSIGDSAFGGYGLHLLSSVTIEEPSQLETIGAYAFEGCYALTSFTIPSKVTSIEEGAFEDCVKLIEVKNLSALSIEAGSDEYGGIAANALHVYSEEADSRLSCTEDGFWFYEDGDKVYLTDYTGSESVITLPALSPSGKKYEFLYTFVTKTDPISVVIPEGIETIPTGAFAMCIGLISVTLPSSLTAIEDNAFSECPKLVEIQNLSALDISVGSSDNGGIGECALNVYSPTEGQSNIKEKDNYLFYAGEEEAMLLAYVGDDTELLLPADFEGKAYSIYDYALALSSLTSVSIPANVVSIGEYSFAYCAAMTSVSFAEGSRLETIGYDAFSGCTALTNVTIPSSVTAIGDYAFSDCIKLNAVYITDLAAWCRIEFGCGNANPLYYANHLYLNGELVTDLVIPEGVTTIGNYAFRGCAGLTSITIPSSVTAIGYSAFEDCYKLVEVWNYSGLEITKGFYNYGMVGYYALGVYTSASEKSKVVREGDYLFYADGDSVYLIGYNGTDMSLTLPSDFNGKKYSIHNYAFYNCDSIVSVTIPEGVTSIGEYAFMNCTGLTSVIIPGSVTFLGNGVFGGCIGLTSVTISEGVTTIGNMAFLGCTGLTSVTIPASVTYIGTRAFSSCNNLTSVTFADTNRWCLFDAESIDVTDPVKNASLLTSDALGSLRKLHENHTFVDTIVPPTCSDQGYTTHVCECGYQYKDNYVPATGRHVFENGQCIYCGEETQLYYELTNDGRGYSVTGCSDFIPADLTIPDTYEGLPVVEIGSWAFRDRQSLRSVTIPSSVTTIGRSAFEGCTGLTSVTIPEGVTTIGESAFRDCTGLTSVTIPEGVTIIDWCAFYGCTGLDAVYITDIAAWCRITFKGDHSLTSANPLAYAHNLYLNGELVTDFTIPEDVTTIGDYAFYGCTGLTSVTIPSSVTTIGNYAFYGCTGLDAVYITDIAAWCRIEFGSGNANPLYYANHLYLNVNGEFVTDLVIPEGVTTIGGYAFYGYKGLTSMTISEGVTDIGWSAFEGCTGLTSVNIPSSVTTIGSSAFEGCTGLTSITIPSSITAIGNRAFSWCTGLTSINIPESVTTIGYYAFSWCTGLTSVTISKGVKTIGDYAFGSCYKLVEVRNDSSLSIVKGSTGNGYVGYYALNIYTPTTGNSKLVQKGDYLFYADGDTVYLIGYTGTDTAITLPSDFDGKPYSIYNHAFYDRGDLTSVIISEGVTAIGDWAFCGCTGLIGVTIPKSVTTIGDYAFAWCCKLVEVWNYSGLEITKGSYDYYGQVGYYAQWIYTSASEKSKVVQKDDYLFYEDGDTIYLIGYNGTDTILTLPSDFNGKKYSIYNYAFYKHVGITSVIIPEGVTAIGDGAFWGCTSLASVTIPSSVTIIGVYAFADGVINYYGSMWLSSSRCLSDIYFSGTIAQWNAIKIDNKWNGDVHITSFTVHCTDGDIVNG